MQFAPLIKEIGRGSKGARDMDAATAEALFGAILDGEVPDLELGAILLSLRIKGESAAELLGFVAAMQARTALVEVPDGPRCVLLPTFNGARKQANLMPLVALLLAREGVPALMFGRHDFDSRENPFALLAALGLPISANVDEAFAPLRSTRLAALPLSALNPGLDRLMALRPRLGLRNSGHSVANLIESLARACGRHASPLLPLAALPVAELAAARHIVFIVIDGFGQKIQEAELDYLINSEAGSRSVAENYVGLPLNFGE